VNAATGAVTGPNAGAFLIDNGNASAINIGGTTGTTLNLGRTGQTQALLGNGTVAGTLGVTGATTLTGALTANGAASFTSTVKVGSTGTALTEIRTGTCSIVDTSIPPQNSAATTCTIAGGVQDLLTNGYVIEVSPRTALPGFVVYTVGAPTTTAIVLQWSNPDQNGAHPTGAITFNWFAVR
jgi:hypothetical protein